MFSSVNTCPACRCRIGNAAFAVVPRPNCVCSVATRLVRDVLSAADLDVDVLERVRLHEIPAGAADLVLEEREPVVGRRVGGAERRLQHVARERDRPVSSAENLISLGMSVSALELETYQSSVQSRRASRRSSSAVTSRRARGRSCDAPRSWFADELGVPRSECRSRAAAGPSASWKLLLVRVEIAASSSVFRT